MATINGNYDKLAAGYLFPEIAKRAKAYSMKNPGTKLLKLGIGNSTEPLAPTVVAGLKLGADKLAKAETYTGYGDEQGDARLRKAIAAQYAKLGADVADNEVFVSDGAKPDVGNIQSIFSADCVVAVQDPAYPVYVDTNVIAGRGGKFDAAGGCYDRLVYMPCTEDNGFFPEVPKQKVDLIYICSPNNPTGAVATKEQLAKFVEYARKNKAVIIFDAAYSQYISDPKLPRSIYEVPGAKECAIEINSFSKSAGFTGVRLGWTIVPMACVCENAPAGKLNGMWNRRQCTFFNGASNIVQEGGLAALSEQGQKECKETIDYYMENAKVIREGFTAIGLKVYGGINAPYLWVKTPKGIKSWEFFDILLTQAHVVTTPGAGFGPHGEGFMRVSAFGHRLDITEAVESVKKNLKV
ncbi:MAG: LL-diaminopimelate aminotransferase [Candidatus Micrarchaeia archaeon]